MQLPHFDDEVISRLKKRRAEMKIQGKNDIYNFIRLEKKEIEELDLFEGDACRTQKQSDLMAAVAHFPRVTCHVSVYTEIEKLDSDGQVIGTVKEKKCAASDYIKTEFRIKYEHLEEEQTEGYVCSRNYPYLKKHSWHIVMIDAQTNEKVFMNARKLRADEPNKKEKDEDYMPYDGSIYMINKQRIGREGEFPFKVHFISDSYMGFDEEVDFTIKLAEDPDTKEFNYCKEDIRACEANTGIQALFAEEEDSESDETESEEETLTATERLKLRLQEAGHEDALD